MILKSSDCSEFLQPWVNKELKLKLSESCAATGLGQGRW